MRGEGILPVPECRNVEGPPATDVVRALRYPRHLAIAEAFPVTRESGMPAPTVPAYSVSRECLDVDQRRPGDAGGSIRRGDFYDVGSRPQVGRQLA